MGEGKGEELIKVTLQHIHEQEENLANAKKAAAAALEKLQMAKFALREPPQSSVRRHDLPVTVVPAWVVAAALRRRPASCIFHPSALTLPRQRIEEELSVLLKKRSGEGVLPLSA